MVWLRCKVFATKLESSYFLASIMHGTTKMDHVYCALNEWEVWFGNNKCLIWWWESLLPIQVCHYTLPPDYPLILYWCGRAGNTERPMPLGFLIIWSAGLPCHCCPSAGACFRSLPSSPWTKVYHCAAAVWHLITIRILFFWPRTSKNKQDAHPLFILQHYK